MYSTFMFNVEKTCVMIKIFEYLFDHLSRIIYWLEDKQAIYKIS